MGKILLSTILVLSCFFVFSQDNGRVQGTITDAEIIGEPLLFAHVSLKSTTHSVQTNFHGHFELTDIAPGDYTLFVQYPGYESLEVPLSIKQDLITRVDESMQVRTLNMSTAAKTEIISSTIIAESPSSSDK